MHPFASVAVTVIGNEPLSVVVPEKAPPDESETPVGSVPAVTAYVTVPMPPACVSVAAYGTLVVA